MFGAVKKVVVFPGSFDPLTRGHLDIIQRGAAIFDGLIVAVSENPQKSPLLSTRARLGAIRRATAGMPNVRVCAYRGLTVDFARRAGANIILRGLRDAADLRAELQMAATNRAVAGVETMFLPADPRHVFTSSTLIRQIARGGGDVSALVPPETLAALARLAPGGRTRRPNKKKHGSPRIARI
jgi:pantetheine-phosphate adenylyltransferase